MKHITISALSVLVIVTCSAQPPKDVALAAGSTTQIQRNYSETGLTPSSFRVVDDDTVECSDLNFRLIGPGTNETHLAKCDSERALGNEPAESLRQIHQSGTGDQSDFKRGERRPPKRQSCACECEGYEPCGNSLVAIWERYSNLIRAI